jgi:hypothetical protein
VTDATTDQLTDETTPAPDEGPEYVVTPTLRGFSELVARVEHLEASSEAIGDDTTDPDEQTGDALTQARLTRHRGEIERIKVTLNAIIEYLTVPNAQLPAAIPAAPVAAPVTAAPAAAATPDPAGATQ